MKLEQLVKNIEDHIVEIETVGITDVKEVESHLKQILQHIYNLQKEYSLFREANG